MKKPDKPAIVARMPKQLVRQLDKASRASGRSRSAEIVQRLLESFSSSEAPTSAPSRAASGAPKTARGAAAQQVKPLREVTHAG